MRGFAMLDIGKTGFIDVPDPVIKNPQDTIVEITSVAMCTSDVHNVQTGAFKGMIGHAIGHEAVGKVVEVGSGVKDFKVGDRVTVRNVSPVFTDMDGQRGFPHLSLKGNRLLNPEMEGLFTQYAVYENSDSGLAHIPDNVTDTQALMATDMIPTAFSGLDHLDIQFGETVAVVGCGPVGLMGIAGAAIAGAGKIIAVETPERTACVKAAKIYGASEIVDFRQGKLSELLIAANNGQKVDKILICGGNKETLFESFKACVGGGRIASVAGFGCDAIMIPAGGIPHIAYSGCRCKAGRLYLERLLALIAHGRLDPSHLVTHTLHGFDSIPEAFEIMSNKNLPDLIKAISIY